MRSPATRAAAPPSSSSSRWPGGRRAHGTAAAEGILASIRQISRYRLGGMPPLVRLRAAVVPLVARPCRLLCWRSRQDRSGWRPALSANAHAPHPRRLQQLAGGPCCPLGRPATADPAAAQAAGAADPPSTRRGAELPHLGEAQGEPALNHRGQCVCIPRPAFRCTDC